MPVSAVMLARIGPLDRSLLLGGLSWSTPTSQTSTSSSREFFGWISCRPGLPQAQGGRDTHLVSGLETCCYYYCCFPVVVRPSPQDLVSQWWNLTRGSCVVVTGATAEYARVAEKNVVRVPSNISLEEAAGIPLAGCTAW
jgi:hypothetical protein